jgi:acetyl esterase/lipase
MTGELDAMAPAGRRFADDLAAIGVPVTYREFACVEHGFTSIKPVDVAMTALDARVSHL